MSSSAKFSDTMSTYLCIMFRRNVVVILLGRVFQEYPKVTLALLLSTIYYYLDHVRYLYTGHVDYNYNMAVNIFFGVLGSLIWTVWAVYNYHAGRRYTWRLLAFVMLSGVTLLLELLDFPPEGGVWDAHALWHLSTAPLPLLFYRFVIDDLEYLRTSKLPIKKSDLKLP